MSAPQDAPGRAPPTPIAVRATHARGGAGKDVIFVTDDLPEPARRLMDAQVFVSAE